MLTKKDLKGLTMYRACMVLLKNDLSEKYENQLKVLTGVIFSLVGSSALISLEENGYFVHNGEVFTIMYNGAKDLLFLLPVCKDDNEEYKEKFNYN